MELKEGQRFLTPNERYFRWIEIMAIRGNYIMAKRNNASPFVQTKKEFEARLIRESLVPKEVK